MTKNKINSISPAEFATYTVCPHSWLLKKKQNPRIDHDFSAKIQKQHWYNTQEKATRVQTYLTVIAVLIFLLIFALFFRDGILDQDKININEYYNEIFFLLVISGSLIFILRTLKNYFKALRDNTGLNTKDKIVQLKDSDLLDSKVYYSKEYGICAKPDAIIKDHNTYIPVLIKTKSNKVKDRHAIEILAHIKALEESTNNHSPYGIIILGKDHRRVQIKNTEDRQNWLKILSEEMHTILEQDIPAEARPSKFKCKMCDVKNLCDQKIE